MLPGISAVTGLVFWVLFSPLTLLAAIQTPPDKYEVLSGEGLVGSGFVIRHGNALYGVTSIHQFQGKVPATLEPIEGDSIRLDKSRVVRQTDVQIAPVIAPSHKLQVLDYSQEFILTAGEDVIILGPAGDVVDGKLTTKGLNGIRFNSADGPRELEVRASEPLLMAGGSGGPIVQKRTGKVVGVVLSADNPEKARIIGFETLCLGFTVPKQTATYSTNSAAGKLAQTFPSLYWYASDACLRETTRHGFGQSQKHDEFTKENKAVVEHVQESRRESGSVLNVRLRLFAPESPGEYWIFELSRENTLWRPITGFKYFNGKQTFDLFRDEFLIGVRIMGSMKPYLDKALTAYSSGKSIQTVFTNSAQAVSKIFNRQHLVGAWRRTDPSGKVVTNIRFGADGAFSGSLVENGQIPWSFAGKWRIEQGKLKYEYTSSSNLGIRVGTKDEDSLVHLDRQRYTIRNAVGGIETYIRVN